MTQWTSDQLDKVGHAEELQIASIRRDGTPRKPVTVWAVRLGDELFVRSVKGRSGPKALRKDTRVMCGPVGFGTT
jgi:hypothetical protein